MASCVVSWWMRASIKCGMPTNTTKGSRHHDARRGLLRGRHAGAMCGKTVRMYAQRSERRDKQTMMLTHRWMVQGSPAMMLRDIR
jgi:hypothetical protein